MKMYHMQPWTPKINEVANDLMDKVHNAAPDVEMFFMGAAALGLPGKNDIDLDLCCPTEKISENTEKLIPILGQPKEQDDKMTFWNYFIDDIEIDCILSDPKTSHVPEQKKVFENLKANPELLEEYKKLKISCDGMPYEEYEKKKVAFFHDKVLKELSNE